MHHQISEETPRMNPAPNPRPSSTKPRRHRPFRRRRRLPAVMLRLRSCILTQVLSSSSASPVPPTQRLLSAAAAAATSLISPDPGFAVEDYLVSTCGLTRAQALKASPKLSHLRSSAKPDAVLAFLAGLGLSAADVAALVAKDPKFLCAGVEKTLVPIVDGLTSLGLSRSEIGRLASLIRHQFRCRSIVPKLHYYLRLFGSSQKLLRAINCSNYLPLYQRRVEINVAFLRECGLGDRDIAKLCGSQPRMVTTDLEYVQAMVVLAEGLGVPRGSGMFRYALNAVAFLDEKKIEAKVDHLKKTLRWSDAEVSVALPKAPLLLVKSKEMLQRCSEFLISEAGLEPAYIARRPVTLTYSLEGRLRPRYYVVKFLKENGLVDPDRDFFSAVVMSEKLFMKRYICPHKEAAPCLAEDYADACKGEVPVNFRFT